MNEHLDFEPAVTTLTDSAGRALGSIINKAKSYKDLGYNSFTTLFNACVIPVLTYGSGVWSYNNKLFKLCHNIQKRAMRFYLGVHRFTPIDAMQGDIGWKSIPTLLNIEALRLWNRMLNSKSPLCRAAFQHDLECRGKWSSYIKDILQSIGKDNTFQDQQKLQLRQCEQVMLDQTKAEWKNSCQKKPKLRSYIQFKKEYKAEKYLTFNFNKYDRSLCAQFRSGILPLRIEVGRYRQEPIEARTCDFCHTGAIEDEEHFIFDCTAYTEERSKLFQGSDLLDNPNISRMDVLHLLFENHTCKIVHYIRHSYDKRKQLLYTV